MDELRIAKVLSDVVRSVAPVEILVGHLKEQPELGLFDGKWQCFGNTRGSVTLRQLADWMIERAHFADPRTVVEGLARYVKADNVPFRKIMVLATALVEAPIPLADTTSLVPFDELPESRWKQFVGERYGNSWLHYRPTAAVQYFTSYPRRHCDEAPKDPLDYTEFQILDDVRLCMTCVSRGAPLELGSWAQAEDWVPHLVRSAALPEPFNTGSYGRSMDGDWTELPDLYQRWVALDINVKDHLRVPLGRINSARRSNDLVNAAIDLGIAIDSVFRTGRGYGPVRLRAARMLSNEESERRRIAAQFSLLWQMRCDAVHEGMLKGYAGRQATLETIDSGSSLVCQAIKRYICEGVPDWDRIFLS